MRRLGRKEGEMKEENNHCGNPCPPDDACENCQEFWDRMRAEGYWVDGEGWTEKARQEWKER